MFCKECDLIYEVGSHKYKFAGSKSFQKSTSSAHNKSNYHEVASPRDSLYGLSAGTNKSLYICSSGSRPGGGGGGGAPPLFLFYKKKK